MAIGRIRTGARGEDVAAAWLEAHGLQVIARRTRVAGVEVDIVAVDHAARALAVVEVKTSRTALMPQAAEPRPEESLGCRQLKRLARAAAALGPVARGKGLSLRIDAVAVLLRRSGPSSVHHMRDVCSGPGS